MESQTPSLADLCGRYATEDGVSHTPIDGMSIYRRDRVIEKGHTIYTRRLFLVAQGRKRAMIGDEIFAYDPEHYLAISVPLPVMSQILEATPERPFLSIALDIPIEMIREVALQGREHFATKAAPEPQRGLAVSRLTPRMKDATRRLLTLLETPEDIPVLAEMYIKELLYHVLKGPQGGFLLSLAMGGSHQKAIADVLTLLHDDCTQDINVRALASSVGMSETVFYEAFRAVTASSPVQYVKRLRLLEAHRQMTVCFKNVSEAAYSVGYNSTSQFSREFKRVFGVSPSSYVGP